MNTNARPNAPRRRGPGLLLRTFGLLVVAWSPTIGQEGGTPPRRVESLEKPDGSRVDGALVLDPARGLMFQASSAPKAEPLGRGAAVAVDGPWPVSARAAGLPPFHVILGHDQQISGRLTGLDDRAARLEDGPSGASLSIDRSGIQTISQRPGEAVDVQDGFETLDPTRWAMVGMPVAAAGSKLSGERALRLPASGSAVTRTLASPISAGRIELAFLDDLTVADGHTYFVDLLFRGSSGPESVRAVLGWNDESLAVQSPGGPALVVQRLARRKGWRRLDIRFGPDRTEVAVDGDDLAHGKGPTGPLVEVRIGTERQPKAPSAPQDLAATLDDLRVVRQAGSAGSPEVDPSQDEVRLVEGDQIFGTLGSADSDRVILKIDGKDYPFPWREVAAVRLRREPRPASLLDGDWVRLAWRAGPGNDIHDLDRIEGVLKGLTPATLVVATPFAGTLTIPRDQVRRLEVLGKGARLLLDPFAHHLGDEIARESAPLDPPQPEGSVLEQTFTLERVPTAQAFVALDVVQVVGEDKSLPFADDVARGELRTNVLLNGKPVDYINRYIRDRNESPERIRLPIPAGLLKAGTNTLRIKQDVRVKDNYVDDLGLLGIALEFEPSAQAGPGTR